MSPIPTAKQLVYLLRVTPFGKLSQSNQAHCQNSSSNRNTQDILSGQSAKKESHESRNTNRNSVGQLRHNMDDMVAGSTGRREHSRIGDRGALVRSEERRVGK